jgi:tetratricopeptide (TPR) repeat protein
MKIFQELLDKILNYQKCLENGKEAFAAQQLDKAQKYFQKVIDHLAKRGSLDALKKRYLGEAFLGLGNIYDARKESSPAIDYYIKALNNSVALSNLPDSAIVLLGTTLCSKKDQSERAIEIFLRYMKLKPQDSIANKIYSFLESLCFVNESQEPHVRKKAMALNQRVQSVNPNIEWTYYYLGVSAYVENDKANAQEHFLNAIKLNAKRAWSYYWLGKIFGDLNQIELAGKHFLKFIELIPNDDEPLKQAETFFYLGTALIQGIGGFSDAPDLSIKTNREALEKAAKYFDQASSKNERDDIIVFSLARTLSLLNIHDQAISAYKKAIEINNKNSEYYYLLAVELKKLKHYQDAIKNTISAVSIDDQDKYHQLLAELYLVSGNYSASENESLKVYGKNSVYDSEALCILTYALYHQSKYMIIIDICEKYRGKLAFNKKYPDVYYYIARAYSNADKFGKAIEWYIKLIEIKERADAIYYLGCALANKGDYDKALTAFKRIIDKETEYQALTYLQRGVVYSKLSQLKEAEDDFVKACSIAPENINILYSIGLFYYLAGDTEKPMKYLSELLAIKSENCAARFMRGHIYEKRGEIKPAINEYESLLGDGRFALQSHLRLGILYFRQSDYKRAFEYLQQAYQSGDKSDALLFYCGLIFALNNHFMTALQCWNELLDRYPKDERLKLNIYRVHYLLGCSYIKENKYAEAIKEWKEYLKGYAEDIKTKKSLAELYFRLFVAEIKTGDIRKAREFVLQSAELVEDNKKYIFYAALCDCKLGGFDECVNHLDKLMNTELGASGIKYHKSVALMRKGEKAEAIKILSELSTVNEKNIYVSHAKWLIADEYILNRQYENAIPILEALLC